ncbi:MAG: ankyrin repeat domain-containing protein, partial [Candidatus Obscuribacterales bacterium]|nr:ankyrin repeat domain-containing protein [Candidatus Obscuribacterales bacterium]
DFASLCMHKLIDAGQIELVERFLDCNIDPNIRGANASTPLIIAAKKGHFEICKLLISRGGDPTLCDSSGLKLAFAAIEGGNTELLKYVLSLGQEFNVETDSGQAFSIAARNSHIEMIDLLLELGLDVNGKNFINSTALHDPGSTEVVRALVAAGANLEGLDGSEETPLIRMSGSSKADVVRALIDAGANIAAEGKWGDTALSRAKAHNQQASLKVLQDVNAPDKGARREVSHKSVAVFMTVPLASSAKEVSINAEIAAPKEPTMPPIPPVLPTAPHKPGEKPAPPKVSAQPSVKEPMAPKSKQASEPPAKEQAIPTTVITFTFPGHNTCGQLKDLFEAVTEKNVEKTRNIIASGFDPNNADDEKRTPLMWAAAGNAVEIVRILLEAGANPNSHRDDGTTPLQWAIQNVRNGDTKTVELLLEKGADPNLSGSSMPLSEAVRKNQPEVVEILLKAGVKTDPSGNQLGNLLCQAASAGSLSIVKILHSAGARLDAYDFHGFTSLMRSVRHIDVFEYLLNNGADVDLPASGFMGSHETAFMRAAAEGCTDAMAILLKHKRKPDLNNRNSLGETALMLAAEKGHPEAVRLLLSSGADPA